MSLVSSVYNDNRKLLCGLFLLALLPRLMLAICLDPTSAGYTDPLYEKFARNVSLGNGLVAELDYPGVSKPVTLRSFRPPLFPYLWGLAYGITGGAYRPIRACQSVLGALACLIPFFVGSQVLSRRVGVLASVFSALYPPLIWHSSNLMTEPLFILFFLLSVMLLIDGRRRESWIVCGAAGVASALGILSRSVLVGFVPLAGFWLLAPAPSKKRLVLCAALWGATGLTMTPWIVRNYLVYGVLVPTTTDGGHGFYKGNNEDTLSDPRVEHMPESFAFLGGLDELEINQRFYRLGREFIAKNPGALLRLAFAKFRRFWRPYPDLYYLHDMEPDAPKSKYVIAVVVYGVSYLSVLPLIVAGGMLAYKDEHAARRDFWLIFVALIYMVLIHIIYIVVLRYRVPLMPLMFLFAAYAVCRLKDRFSRAGTDER